MRWFILIFWIFFSTVLAQAKPQEINEYLNDVYFANGINTDDASAESTKNRIQKHYKYHNPTFYKSVNDWKVSVNHTEGVALDLVEAASQSVAIEWWGQAYKWWTDVKKYVLTLVKSAFAEYIQGEVEDKLKSSMTKILFTHQVDGRKGDRLL